MTKANSNTPDGSHFGEVFQGSSICQKAGDGVSTRGPELHRPTFSSGTRETLAVDRDTAEYKEKIDVAACSDSPELQPLPGFTPSLFPPVSRFFCFTLSNRNQSASISWGSGLVRPQYLGFDL